MFIVHNLGMTGGVRVLKGTYTKTDINNMRYQLPDDLRGGTDQDIVTNYATRYNIEIPKRAT